MEHSIREIEKQLKQELDPDRFEHTIGVMYTAASLAMAHGADINQAILAGLLHDCAKCMHEKVAKCEEYGIAIRPIEQENPFLLHAKLGAYVAKTKYNIEDSDILHAIEVHTTGDSNMNTLDKIVYIADYIEPNRTKAADLAIVRPMAYKDLDQTMETILFDTLQYLESTGGSIDEMTRQAYVSFAGRKES